MDNAKVESFQERLFTELNGAMSCLSIYIGHELGLFDVLSKSGPITSQDFASRARINQRYAQEWLSCLAAGEYLDYEPATGNFLLPEEHAEVDERLQAADDHRKVAGSRAADRSVSRTDLGASASLRSRWIHEIEDTTKIPLAKLRPYLDTPCLDKAIRGYIRGVAVKEQMQPGGSKELKGVRIYQEHKSVVR